MSNASQLIEQPSLFAAYCLAVIHKTFIALDGAYAAASLLSALLLALAFLLRHRLSSRRIPSLRVLRRALLPRRLVASPSGRADVGLFLFNVFLFGLIFGWMLITAHFVAAAVGKGLVTMLGPPQPPALPEIVAMALVVAALLLAYEFAYWLDHYLAHTIPFLWEFHKVHHSAEILSPLTNARMHPVDTVVYYNINALVMGATGGLAQYALGKPLPDHRFWYGSALVLVFSYTVGHLHHSHIWIAFTGFWGKLFLSPAHHQIHHSTNPIHFNKNLGHAVGIFDWLFGTLHIPQRKREKLTFGVEPRPANPHTISACLLQPVRDALGHVLAHKRPSDRSHTGEACREAPESAASQVRPLASSGF
jgi:sterol desaturase/sphingolipid hydroxylase (fatty acid hydroxylase superfamily)